MDAELSVQVSASGSVDVGGSLTGADEDLKEATVLDIDSDSSAGPGKGTGTGGAGGPGGTPPAKKGLNEPPKEELNEKDPFEDDTLEADAREVYDWLEETISTMSIKFSTAFDSMPAVPRPLPEEYIFITESDLLAEVRNSPC